MKAMRVLSLLAALFLTTHTFGMTEPNEGRMNGTEIGNTSDTETAESFLVAVGAMKRLGRSTLKLALPGVGEAIEIQIRKTAASARDFARQMAERGWKKLSLGNYLGFILKGGVSLSGLNKVNFEIFQKGEESNEVVSIRVKNNPDLEYDLTQDQLEEMIDSALEND